MYASIAGVHGDLRARISEVEDGLYRAEYLAELNPEPGPETPPERLLLDSHVGDSVESVKWWVEMMALGVGYRRVIWEN